MMALAVFLYIIGAVHFAMSLADADCPVSVKTVLGTIAWPLVIVCALFSTLFSGRGA